MATDGMPRHQVADVRHLAAASGDGYRDPTYVRSFSGEAGTDLQAFGGFLQCGACGHREELGDVGSRLRDGWPQCCGYTMTWWTQRQIDAGEAPREDEG